MCGNCEVFLNQDTFQKHPIETFLLKDMKCFDREGLKND